MIVLTIKNIDEINDKFRDIVLKGLDKSNIIPEIDVKEYSLRECNNEEEKKEILYRLREVNDLLKQCIEKGIFSYKDITSGYVFLKSRYDYDLFRLLYFLKNKLENNKEE